MVDEGNLDPDQQQEEKVGSSVDEVRQEFNSGLQQIQEQIARQNQLFAEQMQAIAAASSKPANDYSYGDDYLTDEEKRIKELEEKVNSIPSQVQANLQKERELNDTVFRLAKDFPEIQSDPKIRQAVLDEHKNVAKSIQDTAEGYELAVMRATRKAGLRPSSERKVTDSDEFIASGSSSARAGAGKGGKKPSVDPKTLVVAELLGRDINDPKVLKGLEEASKRERWGKFS